MTDRWVHARLFTNASLDAYGKPCARPTGDGTRIATSNRIPPVGSCLPIVGCVDNNGSTITAWAQALRPYPEPRWFWPSFSWICAKCLV